MNTMTELTHVEPQAYIGQSIQRHEDIRLLTGHGLYVDDVRFPNLAYAAVLRSPHAHARIISIDVGRARALTGVVGILTGKDLSGRVDNIQPNWLIGDPIVPERPVLAIDRVRLVGDAVAFVVADSREIAYDALELIDVEYEPLPAVTDEEAASQAGAPQLHDNVPGNCVSVYKVDGGDCTSAFAQADRIVKLRLVNNRLIPSPLEPRSICASYDPFEEKLTMYLSSQMPHMHKRWLAEHLRWPEHKMRVITPDVGGGFGAKMHLYPEEILCPFAAREFGRPIKWTETRSESHMSTTHGRAHTEYVELAVKNDGRILGMTLKSYANMGAYLSNMAAGIPTINCANQATGIYKIPHYNAEVFLMLTNTPPVDAYRGAGRPEAGYIIERGINLVAHELGLDPVAVRERNMVQPDEFPYAPYNHLRLRWDSGNYQGCMEDALRMVRYAQVRQQQTALRKQGRYIGIGVAGYTELCGIGPSAIQGMFGFNRGGWESAQVRVHTDGKVTLFSGSTATGQGHATAYAQIVADELQLPFEDIDVVAGDTDRVPFGNGTYNSRSVAVGGTAAKLCAAKVLKKAGKYAAAWLDVAPEDVAYAQGVFAVKDQTDGEAVTFAEIARLVHLAHIRPADETPGLDEILFHDPSGMGSPNGVHAVVVEVDIETGSVAIMDYVAVDDVGNVINPMLAAGQVHGGVAQGIGQALYEEVRFDEAGQLLSGSLLDYAVPKSDQLPAINAVFRVTPAPSNPLGAKGVGEAGCVAAPPAIVNAVCDALAPFGITHIDMPLTPPRVWQAIRLAKQQGVKQ